MKKFFEKIWLWIKPRLVQLILAILAGNEVAPIVMDQFAPQENPQTFSISSELAGRASDTPDIKTPEAEVKFVSLRVNFEKGKVIGVEQNTEIEPFVGITDEPADSINFQTYHFEMLVERTYSKEEAGLPDREESDLYTMRHSRSSAEGLTKDFIKDVGAKFKLDHPTLKLKGGTIVVIEQK